MSRMDSTLFVQYQVPQQFSFLSGDMYGQVYQTGSPIAQPSSFMRSSAQQNLHSSSPRQFYTQGYSRSPVEGYQDDSLSSSSSSSSNGIPVGMTLPEHSQEYQEPNYHFTATSAATPYSLESSVPRNMPWAKEESVNYTHVPSTSFEQHLPNGRYGDAQLYHQGYFDRAPEPQYSSPEIPPFYEGHAAALSQEQVLTAYTAQGELGYQLNWPSQLKAQQRTPCPQSFIVSHKAPG